MAQGQCGWQLCGGNMSAGVMLTNAAGEILLSGWRLLLQSSATDDAELMACKEGLTVAHNWFQGPLLLEIDRSSCIAMLKDRGKRSIQTGSDGSGLAK